MSLSTTTLVVEEQRPTLLGRIQADIRADRAPPGLPLPGAADERVLLEPDDRSLQVHACHGRARQVEVVRDAILHLLADDPTLEPRDIVVMCPDIEVFAPLIHATFGTAADGRRTRTTRCRPARRGSTCTCGSPTARCARPTRCSVSSRKLLDLAGGRLTASQVLDLAGRAPVRRRFRLDDDDLDADRAVGARQRRALGPRCGAACLVPARPAAGQHVAGGLGSRAGGRGDGGGGTAAVRRSAAARRRRQRRHRPRRPLRRVPRAPARDRGRVRRVRCRSTPGRRRSPKPPTA